MAETTFPKEDAAEPLVYRPLCGFAIASFLIGVGFAAYLLLVGLWCLRDRSPLLLPLLVPAIPFGGAALAVGAFLRIRNAEGTLAGWKLAQWGWWLNLLCGLGYLAYYVAVYLAVTSQAETYTLRCFAYVKQGKDKLNNAFLMTLPPAQRENVNPEDEQELRLRFGRSMGGGGTGQLAPLDNFRYDELVRFIAQGGDKTQIEPLGVREWEYKNDAYRVLRSYRITTEEGSYLVAMRTLGSESRTREYKGRQWQVEWREHKIEQKDYSPLGQRLIQLSDDSRQFADYWMGEVRQGRVLQAYLETCDPVRRPALLAEFTGRRIAAALATATAPAVEGVATALRLVPVLVPELARVGYLPRPAETAASYEALFDQAGLLKTDQLEPDSDRTRAAVRNALRRLLGGVSDGTALLTMPSERTLALSHWQAVGDRLQIDGPREFGLREPDGKMYRLRGYLRVETDSGATATNAPTAWRVVSLELVAANEMTREMMMRMAGRGAMRAGSMGRRPGR